MALAWDSGQLTDSFSALATVRERISTVTEEAKTIVLANYRTPESLKAFIELQGTPVLIIQPGLKGEWWLTLKLKTLGYESGFIPATDSARYEKLIKHLQKHCSRQLEESCLSGADTSIYNNGIFVLTPSQFTVGYLAHQLHHWLAFKAGLKGYNEQEQGLYQTFWGQHQGQVTAKLLTGLSKQDAQSLRNAIHRDLEALRFLQRVVDEIFIPGKQGDSLMNRV